jgi:hypothetical protein
MLIYKDQLTQAMQRRSVGSVDWSVTILAVGSALLLVAGAGKLRDPTNTRQVLRAMDLPSARATVRALAVAEIAIGGGALAFGSPLTAALVAVAYVLFACFIVVLRHRAGPTVSCGCFGSAAINPGITHVAVNVTIALGIAAGIAGGGSLNVSQVVDMSPAGAVYALGLAALIRLTYVALTVLPNLLSEYGRHGPGRPADNQHRPASTFSISHVNGA